MVVVAARLVRAGRREAPAERIRLAEQAQLQAVQSLDAVWGMTDQEFEEYVPMLYSRDGCTDVRRAGGAGGLGGDVIGYLPDGGRLVI
ncbi:hypothetical protein PV341_18945 [Streptomyces sp. PA03-1a]|nr:hypothetical protein [Streptomyces sp. PA03-1a]MDX2816186.1 hypothetical protein [Streptomyces sp. PA03-5A]